MLTEQCPGCGKTHPPNVHTCEEAEKTRLSIHQRAALDAKNRVAAQREADDVDTR